jgi:hypothetical protein
MFSFCPAQLTLDLPHRLRFFRSLTPGPSPFFIDEDYTRGRQVGADRRKAVRQRRPASNLEVGQ